MSGKYIALMIVVTISLISILMQACKQKNDEMPPENRETELFSQEVPVDDHEEVKEYERKCRTIGLTSQHN